MQPDSLVYTHLTMSSTPMSKRSRIDAGIEDDNEAPTKRMCLPSASAPRTSISDECASATCASVIDECASPTTEHAPSTEDTTTPEEADTTSTRSDTVSDATSDTVSDPRTTCTVAEPGARCDTAPQGVAPQGVHRGAAVSLPTMSEFRARVLDALLRPLAEGEVIPPLRDPHFPIVLLGAGIRKAATGGPSLRPRMLSLLDMTSWRTRHALPTREPDTTTFVDVRDAAGRLVPAPPAIAPVIAHITDSRRAVCSKRGVEAEHAFRTVMEARGWRMRHIVDARAADKCMHIDLMLRGHARHVTRVGGAPLDCGGDGEETVELWVDVKSMRAVRSGGALHNSTLVIELHARGYLQTGKADVMAYEVFSPSAPECVGMLADARDMQRLAADGSQDSELRSTFLLLDRIKLRDWACASLDMDAPPVPFADQSMGRLYCRQDYAKSVITNVCARAAYEAAGCGVVY